MVGENQYYTRFNDYSALSIESHERSKKFQSMDRFVNKTQCMFKFKYERHMMLPVQAYSVESKSFHLNREFIWLKLYPYDQFQRTKGVIMIYHLFHLNGKKFQWKHGVVNRTDIFSQYVTVIREILSAHD